MKHSKIKLLAFLAWQALSAQAEAGAFGGDFQAYGGFRKDQITTTIHSFDTAGEFILSDHLRGKDIHIREWGSKGAICCGPCMIRGDSRYGKVYSGKYEETVDVVGQQPFETAAKIDHGHTRDINFGGGYLLDCCFLKLALCSGWSYHLQDIKMKGALSDGEPDPVLDKLRYKTRWNGPWVGVDCICNLVCLQVNASYEYHFAHWRAKWLLEGPDIPGGSYSDKRESNDGRGHVVGADFYWFYCPGTYLSINLSGQWWEVKNGKEKPVNGTFAEIGHPEVGEDKINKVTWTSYAIMFGCGSTF